jgi:hypothetical protein
MNESNIKGISVRAFIAVILVIACVTLAFMKIPIDETLKYLVVSVISFYFGNKIPNPSQTPSDAPDATVAQKTPIAEVKP